MFDETALSAQGSAITQGLAQVNKLRSNAETRDESKELLAELKQARDALHNEARNAQERYIRLQVKYFSFLEKNPDATLDQIKTHFTEDQLDKQDLLLLKNITHEFKFRRKRAKAIVNKYERQAAKSLQKNGTSNEDESLELEAGRLFFKDLTGHDPQGPVRIMSLNFACGLSVIAEADGLRIDNRNVGGHYSDSTNLGGITLSNLFNRFSYQTFPFILVNAGAQLTAERHEENHGYNRAFSKGINKTDKKLIRGVGTITDNSYDNQDIHLSEPSTPTAIKLQKIKTEFLKDGSDTAELREKVLAELTEEVWDWALNKAKDELVADFVADSDFSHVLNLLAYSFKQPGPRDEHHDAARAISLESYQFLARAGFTMNSFADSAVTRAVYDSIVNEYNQVLTENVKYLEEVWNNFKIFADGGEKRKIITGFMRQNPLQTWKQRGLLVFGHEINKRAPLISETRRLTADISSTVFGLRNVDKSLSINKEIEWLSRENFQVNTEKLELENEIKDVIETLNKLEQLLMGENNYLKLVPIAPIDENLRADISLKIEKANSLIDKANQKKAEFTALAEEKLDRLIDDHPLNRFQKNVEELFEHELNNFHKLRTIVIDQFTFDTKSYFGETSRITLPEIFSVFYFLYTEDNVESDVLAERVVNKRDFVRAERKPALIAEFTQVIEYIKATYADPINIIKEASRQEKANFDQRRKVTDVIFLFRDDLFKIMRSHDSALEKLTKLDKLFSTLDLETQRQILHLDQNTIKDYQNKLDTNEALISQLLLEEQAA